MSEGQGTKKRSVWGAVGLSLLMPGLGHAYCGKLSICIIIMIWSLIITPVFAAAFAGGRFLLAEVLFIVVVLVDIAIVIEAGLRAKRLDSGYQLKRCNSWKVYILLLIIGLGFYNLERKLVRINLVEIFDIPTISNYPTFIPGDRLAANKLVYKCETPKRGDLAVIISPEDSGIYFVKRIIAVAGDRVEIKDNDVFVNGQELEREKVSYGDLNGIKVGFQGVPLAGDVYYETNGEVRYKIFLADVQYDEKKDSFEKITVAPNQYFVLGDNRNMSRDSRHFGCVEQDKIIARADYICWPAKDWSRFGVINGEK
ncbi:MAG: signal peptidase I [Sedimentisphaeraceae bacterium JB056]